MAVQARSFEVQPRSVEVRRRSAEVHRGSAEVRRCSVSVFLRSDSVAGRSRLVDGGSARVAPVPARSRRAPRTIGAIHRRSRDAPGSLRSIHSTTVAGPSLSPDVAAPLSATSRRYADGSRRIARDDRVRPPYSLHVKSRPILVNARLAGHYDGPLNASLTPTFRRCLASISRTGDNTYVATSSSRLVGLDAADPDVTRLAVRASRPAGERILSVVS